MASLMEYYEKLSTTQLQALLREECAGRGNLPTEAILQLCESSLNETTSGQPTKTPYCKSAATIWNDKLLFIL